MPILVVNGHRIFEQEEVGTNLTDYAFAVDKTGETEAEKIGAERIVLTGKELNGVNGYQEISGRKWFNTRLLLKQVTAQASANNLVLVEGQAFSINTITNEIQTINNNGWTGGSIIFLEVLTGQQIKNNAADYGLGNYNGISLSCGSDWTAVQKTVLLLKYNNVSKKWEEVGQTSVITGNSGVGAAGEITHQRVFVTAADIEARTKTITLLYSIAPETHVFVKYCSQDLSRGTIGGSFSYTEKGQTVTIDFDNTVDFGEENKYEPQIGDDIVVMYTKYLPTPTTELGAYVDSVVGSVSGINASFLITVLPDTDDTVAIVNWTLYNSIPTLIQSGTYTINTALTHVHNLNFPDLPNEDYTLEAWVDVGEEVDDTVAILATAAKFQKVDITYRRTSATTIEVIQTMKNIGDASGDFGLYLTLENTVPAQVSISPLITKTLDIGQTVAYVYEHTGVSSIEYDAYSKCEDTVYLYNVPGDYYTVI